MFPRAPLRHSTPRIRLPFKTHTERRNQWPMGKQSQPVSRWMTRTRERSRVSYRPVRRCLLWCITACRLVSSSKTKPCQFGTDQLRRSVLAFMRHHVYRSPDELKRQNAAAVSLCCLATQSRLSTFSLCLFSPKRSCFRGSLQACLRLKCLRTCKRILKILLKKHAYFFACKTHRPNENFLEKITIFRGYRVTFQNFLHHCNKYNRVSYAVTRNNGDIWENNSEIILIIVQL